MAKVLVVGGAGYVGSASCAWLVDRGHEVWVLDDLSTGLRSLALGKGFTLGKAGDVETVGRLIRQEKFDCVMHFAALASVAESMNYPEKYFENNIEQTRALVETMLAHGLRKFIFSSTAAVFGTPECDSISEEMPKRPINPYGESKLRAELMLESFAVKSGLQAIALRYFNAAGAEAGNRVGECHRDETHLIPNILKASIGGHAVDVFGKDYPTPDGTCVRDYVHVSDLAHAHEAAMLRLISRDEPGFESYNLGSQNGYSVKQVVDACSIVVGKSIPINFKPRRPGDPAKLVADSSRARRVLKFEPAPNSLNKIIRSAWNWEKQRRVVRKAVFLDRDGTINDDPGYLSNPDHMKLLPNVGEALSSLSQAGYLLVVISNQSGVGRGLISREALPRIHHRLNELLAPYDTRIDHYELCFHLPEDLCECRKPKAKLLRDAASALNIDLEQSFMIGDKRSDLQAGRGAGCLGVGLVLTGDGTKAQAEIGAGESDFVGNSLSDAAEWILSQSKSNLKNVSS